MVILAKHLGGGLAPALGDAHARETLFTRAYGKQFASGESHNTTMGFNALTAVAALAALELLTDELIAKVARDGEHLKARLHEALSGSPLFREVRGAGFMHGVALHAPDHPWLTFEHFGFPELGRSVGGLAARVPPALQARLLLLHVRARLEHLPPPAAVRHPRERLDASWKRWPRSRYVEGLG